MVWISVCATESLTPGRGVCALVEGEQVAVFLLESGEVFAFGNRDPFSGTYVMSRGLIGSRGDEPIVVSPMFKQAFYIRTGVAVDDAAVRLDTYAARIQEGQLQLDTSMTASENATSLTA